MLPILNHCGTKQVEILDLPAQATEQFLGGLEKFKAEAIFEEKGVRMTIPLYASDEREAMFTAAQIIQATSNFADYVIVENPARYKSETFLESKVMSMLPQDVPRLKIPQITANTLTEVDKVSKAKGKALTFLEASKEKQLPIGSRMELEQWHSVMHKNMQEMAAYLVPDPEKIKNHIEEKKKKSTASIGGAFDL